VSTYTPIATQTLTSAVSSLTFNDIPQTYTDLILTVNTIPYTSSEGNVNLRFNSDSGGNYSTTVIYGSGSTAESGRATNATSVGLFLGNALNNPIVPGAVVQIMNYSNTNVFKTVLNRNNSGLSGNPWTSAFVSLWRNTSAITSLTISRTFTFDIGVGSTFTLYGIASGGPKAFGGDTVTTDGTYYYHTFLSSGLFTPTQDLTNVDYLVIAGGGGGGAHPSSSNASNGGGGGAGGLRTTTSVGGNSGGGGSLESKLSLTKNAPVRVLIGAGGVGRTNSQNPRQGNDSTFATITSKGGGYGGSVNSQDTGWLYGSPGGSGGGGGQNPVTGQAGTANQGYAGGNASASAGGGGGGAGSVGAVGTGSNSSGGGAGGSGLAVAISGSSVTYAAGGGGGNINGSGNATANTGNGGVAGQPSGFNGGSGIVIVRYAV